jgi:sialate O-acetylesterase
MPLPPPPSAAALVLLALLTHSGSSVAEEEPLPSFFLSAGFSSHMVLQQAPARSAVYGFGKGPVSVTVTGSDATGAAVGYTVDAFTVDDGSAPASSSDDPSSSLPTWKAFLKPAAAGGSYTVTAKGATGTVVLSDCTFGDVYFCSGQSNSE